MNASMPVITRESLMSLEAYARARPEFRARVMAHKKNRTLHLGEHVTLIFEDELTIRYQIQEMLRAERVFEEAGIQDERDAYNPLVPDGSNWKATMMIEYADPAERARMLARLIGIEDRVWVQAEGCARVYAIADGRWRLGMDLADIDPAFHRAILKIALELKPEGGPVEVRGREAGTEDAWIWRIELPPVERGAREMPAGAESELTVRATPLPLGALYGRERVADLELEASAVDDASREIDERIESAGLRHRIVTRRTSLVAIAEEPSVDPKLPRRRERLPVEVPSGVSAEGSGLITGMHAGLLGSMLIMKGSGQPLIRAQGLMRRTMPGMGRSLPGTRRFDAEPASTPTRSWGGEAGAADPRPPPRRRAPRRRRGRRRWQNVPAPPPSPRSSRPHDLRSA